MSAECYGPFVCHLVNDFEHKGPNGTHVCLVYELMGETLASFGAWFAHQMIPYPVMRKFTLQLIYALDFAHNRNVIHTGNRFPELVVNQEADRLYQDLKPDNIFVKFRDFSLIEEDYLAHMPLPKQNRDEEAYTPIISVPLLCNYFNEAQIQDIGGFDIALGDWGVSTWADRHLTENIQPVKLRAPEVLIEAPWDSKADVWSLGALILEVYLNVLMFSGRVAPDGHYEIRQHLAEIVDFFGPFSRELLQKGKQELVKEYFDDEGRVKGAEPVDRPGLSLQYFTPGLDDDLRRDFVLFMQEVMTINPSERPSPREMLQLPWLDASGSRARERAAQNEL